ncbi:uncharacterized protein B0H18DRAFT_896135, partial [Fomitopsis serialis]|uniref:uncharacterized protein n=1 Tax=Fomitopsis serialis TaxID=139415 RepID=UPI002007689F
ITRSTTNQRIERRWVDIGTNFARHWRVFFLRLEELHGLDRKNPHHLWLLHCLFLDDIQEDCDLFRHTWNHHGASGPHMQGQTPRDVRWLANITNGKYNEPTDTFANVNPDTLAEHYGVHGPVHVRKSHQTGAGHPPDEENDGIEECFVHEDAGVVLARRLAEEHRANLRHEAIKVPRHTSPFASEQFETAFFQTLEEVYTQNLIPSNMAVSEEEWPDNGYPTEGQLKVGRVRIITIAMPHSVWLVRARRWCQALDLLTRVVY